jgi:4,5-DOPA dioxygenase extradiol
MMFPAVFVSHGAPTLVFEDIPARQFMAGLGAMLGRPDAILCVSAHWETAQPAVSGVAQPETIHDFYGFPEALYRLRYPAPGAPALATRVAKELQAAGFQAAVDPGRGLDQGAWNPLALIYPDADIPVTQLSIQAHLDPEHHRRLGQALRNLRREGRTLILASGGAVHNLRQFAIDSENAAPWALAFDEWLNDRILAGDEEALVAYRATRPEAKLAHPRDEHFLPLFVAMGAGEGRPGRALHRSFAHGSLSMASYAWG